MNHNNGELDRILEEGLATYSKGEPLSGLEERVLSRVTDASGVKQRRIWRWILVALPAAACLLVAVSLMWHRQEVPTAPLVNEYAKVQPDPVRPQFPSASPVEQKAVRIEHQAVRAKKILRPASQAVKREQFPTPAPLSPEERALMSLAMAGPLEPEVAFREPAPIEPIRIEPLEIDEHDEEKSQ